jgi:hypothetical protein
MEEQLGREFASADPTAERKMQRFKSAGSAQKSSQHTPQSSRLLAANAI